MQFRDQFGNPGSLSEKGPDHAITAFLCYDGSAPDHVRLNRVMFFESCTPFMQYFCPVLFL